MQALREWLDLILSLATLIGIIIAFYKFSKDPDIKIDKQLGMNQIACEEKHIRIDEIILETKESVKKIKNSILLIKNNDIKHIEQEIRKISQQQTKILTIIEYGGKLSDKETL